MCWLNKIFKLTKIPSNTTDDLWISTKIPSKRKWRKQGTLCSCGKVRLAIVRLTVFIWLFLFSQFSLRFFLSPSPFYSHLLSTELYGLALIKIILCLCVEKKGQPQQKKKKYIERQQQAVFLYIVVVFWRESVRVRVNLCYERVSLWCTLHGGLNWTECRVWEWWKPNNFLTLQIVDVHTHTHIHPWRTKWIKIKMNLIFNCRARDKAKIIIISSNSSSSKYQWQTAVAPPK